MTTPQPTTLREYIAGRLKLLGKESRPKSYSHHLGVYCDERIEELQLLEHWLDANEARPASPESACICGSGYNSACMWPGHNQPSNEAKPEAKAELIGLNHAIDVTLSKRLPGRVDAYYAALDDVETCLRAAVERVEAGEGMSATASTRSAPHPTPTTVDDGGAINKDAHTLAMIAEGLENPNAVDFTTDRRICLAAYLRCVAGRIIADAMLAEMKKGQE